MSLADANAARHTQGPLERNVLKNLLAMEIAAHAQRSARAVSAAEPAVAQVALNYALSLINQLRNSVPGWENDAELLADEQRLRGFLSALSIGNTNTLAAELEYAAYRKLLPATFNQDE